MNVGDKVFVSRNALTTGVAEETVDHTDSTSGDYIWSKESGWRGLKIDRDAFVTKEEAIVAAEGMRKRKIASLKKQVEKLEKMVF